MKNLLIMLLMIAAANGFSHKFYISIADMEYNEEKERIEVSLKMTAHDFEWVLEQRFKSRCTIEEIADSSEVGEYAQDYIRQNFQLFSQNEQCLFTYIGKEVTNTEELYFFFTFSMIKNPAHINIISNLLFSISDLQQNIVHYKYKNQRKSLTLVPSQNKGELKFQ